MMHVLNTKIEDDDKQMLYVNILFGFAGYYEVKTEKDKQASRIQEAFDIQTFEILHMTEFPRKTDLKIEELICMLALFLDPYFFAEYICSYFPLYFHHDLFYYIPDYNRLSQVSQVLNHHCNFLLMHIYLDSYRNNQ